MTKKPSAGKPPANTAHAKALQQNTAALERHTEELTRSSAALAMHTAVLGHISTKQLVYSVLNEPLTLADTTKLSKLGLNFAALAGTAKKIRERGVNVDTGLVQACTTIKDLVKVVETAQGG
jgi:hypothetical protein